jgi:DNA-directed RNA polymerase subunit RPC12/RpoP
MLNNDFFFFDKNEDKPFKNTDEKYVNSINGLLGDRLFASIKSDGIWIESKYTNGKFHLISTWFNTVKQEKKNYNKDRKLHSIDFKLEVFYNDLIFKEIEPHWLLLSELNKFYPDEPCTLLELSKIMSDKSLLEQKIAKLKKLIPKMDEEFQKYSNSSELFASIKASALFTASDKVQMCLSGIVGKRAILLSSLIFGEKEYTHWYNTYLQSLSTRLEKDAKLAQTDLTIDSDNLKLWLGQFSSMVGGYPGSLDALLSHATQSEEIDTNTKLVTQHGQEQLLYTCSKCKNTVAIDTFDLLQSEDNIHCPVCGADSSHLDMVED